jgi:hypothetical protein
MIEFWHWPRARCPFLADTVAEVPKGAEANFPPKNEKCENRRSTRPQTRYGNHRLSLSHGGMVPHIIFIAAPTARRIRVLCLSNIRSGHIGGAARRELGGKESARPVRRYARTAHPSPRRDVCGRHYNISCTTAAGGGGGIRRTRQRGRGIPVGSNRSVVRHTRFAMETVERSADRECPLIELVG